MIKSLNKYGVITEDGRKQEVLAVNEAQADEVAKAMYGEGTTLDATVTPRPLDSDKQMLAELLEEVTQGASTPQGVLEVYTKEHDMLKRLVLLDAMRAADIGQLAKETGEKTANLLRIPYADMMTIALDALLVAKEKLECK